MEGNILLTHTISFTCLYISEMITLTHVLESSRCQAIFWSITDYSMNWIVVLQNATNPQERTYTTHSMLLSWAVTSSLLPLSSRFQRISEERNRTWPDGLASFMWRQIISAPRAFKINMQFISVVKWNMIKEMWPMIKWPIDLLTLTQGHLNHCSDCLSDCHFVMKWLTLLRVPTLCNEGGQSVRLTGLTGPLHHYLRRS